VGQVYPGLGARPRLTALSRLRQLRLTGEGVFVRLREDVRSFLAEERFAALARRYHDPDKAEQMARQVFAPQERVTLLLRVGRVDVHGFDGEE
jgi:hypothetical protein